MNTQRFNSLIKKIKTNKKVVEIIYNEFFLKLKGHVACKFGDLVDAEDVAHDVFTKLMTMEIDYYVEYPKAWLYKIADCHVIDILRTKRPKEVELIEAELGEFDIDTTIIHGDLKDALKTLDCATQQILYLHYWEGYQLDQIAKEMNLSYSNVRTKVSRAYRLLKKFL